MKWIQETIVDQEWDFVVVTPRLINIYLGQYFESLHTVVC